jgi:hypothetical protein
LGSGIKASLWLHPPRQMANEPRENMMRIAIAGSGGLARIFAHYLNATVHPFIILSRQVQLPGGVPATEDNGTNRFPRPNLTWKLLTIRSLLSIMIVKMIFAIPSGASILSYQLSRETPRSTLSTLLLTLTSVDLFRQSLRDHEDVDLVMTP